MPSSQISEVLKRFKEGIISLDDALQKIKSLLYEDLTDIKVDHHRELRKGFPETIYCPGKSTEQIIRASEAILSKGANVLGTRCTKETFEEIIKKIPTAQYHELARAFTVINHPITYREGYIAVVSAGTGDIPIAEEAVVTCETYGSRVEKIYDVGVAGIHRLFDQLPKIRDAVVCIVCAGMEGALPSVVAGLINKPVIGVPTSIGYGANFSGVSALLGMLNTCSSGLAVVNIDNGFGAGTFAVTVHQLVNPLPK
ncbi:MAG: nickel pincer cofactor biosynthesis protein LarB [Candidatus Hydrogenedentes bacterium]|nr:nickel pincer cofactor biosynthesis protein LarB [Candidatus Hydrogenedentota bacterium]